MDVLKGDGEDREPAQVCPSAALTPEQLFESVSSSTPSEEQTSSGGAVRNGTKADEGPWGGASATEQNIIAALQTYKQLNGHLLMSIRFEVPSGDERWPSVTWGYRLGKAVNQLRAKSKNKARLSIGMEEELDKLDFVYEFYQFKWDRIVLPALREFYRVNGHVDVPKSFVVPIGDEAWPKLTWGHRLGHTVVAIRD
ncbi:hypothetical protein PF003_g15154 [Phytophthora fragariae]|nr:hypothetical protein PF003_g15154 [Phytophthora fragariae]